MRVLRTTLVGLFAFALATGAFAGGPAKLMDELRALGDTLEKAIVADDVEAMLAIYDENAISLPNYGPRLEGQAAFRKHHEEMKASGMQIHSFTSDPTDAWECGNQVIEIGTYAISLTMPGNPETIQDKGKYMTVYNRKKDGTLKIRAETWNTDVNPMEMSAHGHEKEHPHEHPHD